MNSHFFLEKIERDGLINSQLIAHLFERFDDLSGTVKASVSRMLNAHHIWNARLKELEPESFLDDALSARYWVQLNEANFMDTLDLLHDFPLITIQTEASEEKRLLFKLEVVYQLLLDNYHFRSQVEYFCKLENIEIPTFNLVTLS